jgi:hypothetical protein
MSISGIKRAARYVTGLAIVVLFVVLLTTIFSFLGAFFCAGLAGMMLGSIKLPRGHVTSLSLVFPAVLFATLRIGGSELPMKQVLLLSTLCLATFWLTYLLVRAVMWYERRGQPAPPVAVVAMTQAGAHVQPFDSSCDNSSGEDQPEAVPGHQDQLSLEVLQGKWSCAADDRSSHREQKLMEIEQDKLVLTVSDSNGKVCFLGQGEVTLSNSHVVRFLTGAMNSRTSTDDTLVCI